MADVDSVSPPDGGWGCLVVLECFMAYSVIAGVKYSFVHYFHELNEYFQEDWIRPLFIQHVFYICLYLSGTDKLYLLEMFT